jgi:hypothetical protein
MKSNKENLSYQKLISIMSLNNEHDYNNETFIEHIELLNEVYNKK